MASSSSAAMKSGLVVVLLLSAVVASQAHQVSCKNTCTKAMALNGMWTAPGGTTTLLDVKREIKVGVIDCRGVKHEGKWKCPEHLKALEIRCVKSKINEISGVESNSVLDPIPFEVEVVMPKVSITVGYSVDIMVSGTIPVIGGH